MNVAGVLTSIDVAAALIAFVCILVLAHRREAFRHRSASLWRGRPDRGRLSPIAVGWRPLLMTIAAVAIAASAALSAWRGEGSRHRAAPAAPTAVVFALDVSRSMEVGDVPPSRLHAARALIARLVGEAAPGAAGLVLFAGEAELTCPLTADGDAFRMALEEVPAAMGTLAGGSAIADALSKAAATFGRSRARRLIVIVSDGEDTGPAAAIEETIERLAGARIGVIAIGIGTPAGASMPARREKVTEAAGSSPPSMRTARLDAARLQRLATATGGEYLDGSDPQTAARLVARLRSATVRPDRRGGEGLLPLVLVLVAFGCLSAESILARARSWRS